MAVLQELFVPLGHSKAHGLLLQALLIGAVQADHAVHQRPVVAAGLAVDVLLQTGQGAKGLNVAVFQIILALGDIAGVIGDGVGHVIAGHGGYTKDGDGAGILKVNGLFIAGSQTAVKVTRIATVRRHLLHGDGHFLLRVCVVGHIGQEDQHPLAVQRKLLGHGQSQVRHQGTFHRGVGGGVNKHHRAAHGTALFQGIPEKQIVIVLQAHAAQDNHIHLRLHGNAGE